MNHRSVAQPFLASICFLLFKLKSVKNTELHEDNFE